MFRAHQGSIVNLLAMPTVVQCWGVKYIELALSYQGQLSIGQLFFGKHWAFRVGKILVKFTSTLPMLDQYISPSGLILGHQYNFNIPKIGHLG